MPCTTKPRGGFCILIKIVVLLFFLSDCGDHRQKEQQWHASKRKMRQQHEQQKQGERQNTIVSGVHANSNTVITAPATSGRCDVFNDLAVSPPHECPSLPALGGLFWYEGIDWQTFDPLVLFLRDWIAFLRGAMLSFLWPETEMALAGTATVGGAHKFIQEETCLVGLNGSWTYIWTVWWPKNITIANIPRCLDNCVSPSSPTSAQVYRCNDPPVHYKDLIKLKPLSRGAVESSILTISFGSTISNKTVPLSPDSSPAMHHHYENNFWLLLGRGRRYHGTALNFLVKAWLPTGAREWLEVTEGRYIDWVRNSMETWGSKITEMAEKLGCWSCRALIGVGMSFSFKAGASCIYCVFKGPTIPYLLSMIAMLFKLWMRKFRRRRGRLPQQAAKDTSAVGRTEAGRLPDGLDHMRMFSFRRRSEDTYDRNDESDAAFAARAQKEEEERQQLREEEKLRGERQHALLKILRSMAAQRRAVDAMAMVDIYTKSWRILRQLYTLERDESTPWSVREGKLRHLWPIFDVHWQALTAWTNGKVPREPSLVLCCTHIGSLKMAHLYSRLARALYVKNNTGTDYKCPRPNATRQDVEDKIHWRESADLAALRPHVLARYWRECGLARQQMWIQGIWAVIVSHPTIQTSVTGYMRSWKPRLRRTQLDHRQVPIWKTLDSGQSDIQILHAIELRSLESQIMASGAGQGGKVTLFSVDMRPQGVLCPSERPYLLNCWLDGATEAKLAMAAMVPIRVAATRSLLEIEPGIGMEERRMRARLRSLVLAFLTDHEMIILETAVAGVMSHFTGIADQRKLFLFSRQAVPLAVALEQARRRGAGVTEHKERKKGNSRTQVLWPNVLELRLDLHHRPPSVDVITRHSHLAAVIMAQHQCHAPKKKTTNTSTRAETQTGAEAGPQYVKQLVESEVNEGIRSHLRSRREGGRVEGGVHVLFTPASLPSIVEYLGVTARNIAQTSLPTLLSARMPIRTQELLASAPPDFQSAVPCPPAHLGAQQRVVRSHPPVGWTPSLTFRRALRAGLLYSLSLVAKYGIPAYVFTIWAWHVYMRWIKDIVANDRAMTSLNPTPPREEAPTIDDIINNLPDIDSIRVTSMDYG